ncbi:MAG: mscL [Acidimicrobiaceae bacterium]|nr:mscL [Acidimicrobiaceae bacterium]
MLKDFKTFIMRGNVVDLAVGIVVGSAFGTVVKALVSDLITPLVSIGGKTNFESLHTRIGHSIFAYGDFLNALIAFLSIAAAVFFFVVRPVEAVNRRLKRRAGDQPPATKECPECCSTIAFAAHRCAYCTAVLEEATAA